MKPFDRKIVLENGREFCGYGFGADREQIGEIVFNTMPLGAKTEKFLQPANK